MYPLFVTSAPPNPARAGECWDLTRIQKQLEVLRCIAAECRGIVISGGMAWHILSPPHTEMKILHDHKDLDLFVSPEHFKGLITTLKALGFSRAWTKYDGRSKTFYRYTEKYDGGKNILDIFAENAPSIEVEVGDIVYQVVEPSHLIGLYESTHSSKLCLAVQAAKKLLAKGISPVGRPELIGG